MSDDLIDEISDSLDDYLVSLADGLAEAQLRLDDMAAVSGPEGIRYQIPKLEFDLKVDFSLQVNTEESGEPVKRFLIKAKNDSSTSTNSKQSVTSTLSGSFVAVPVNQGTPAHVIETELIRKSAKEVLLNVYVNHANGEPAADVEVEVNIDRERSDALNKSEGRSALKPATELSEGVLLTTVDGVASTQLLIATQETKQNRIIVVIDCQGQTETIHYRVVK